jgi:integrase
MSQLALYGDDEEAPPRLAAIRTPATRLESHPGVTEAILMARRKSTKKTQRGRPKGPRAQLGIPEVAPIGNKGRTFDVEILTRDEVHKLRAQLNTKCFTGARNDAIITVLYRTGIRVSELADLRGVDVVLGPEPSVHIRHGKKKGLPRLLPIDADAVAVLRVWKTHRDTATTNGTAPFFCTTQSTKVQEQYVRAMLKRLAAKAFVGKRVHPHCLRHTFCVELASEGRDVIGIQYALGHKSIGTTQIYLRKLGIDPMIRRAMEGRPPWRNDS